MNTFRSRAVVAAAVLGVVVLGGCGAAGHGAGAAGSYSATGGGTAAWSARSTTPTDSPAGATRTATSSVPAPSGPGCREGHCTVTVAQGETLAMDVGRFGFDRLKAVGISRDAVSVEAAGPGIHLSSTVPPGRSSLLNSLNIQVRSVTGHTATLVLTVR
ncbi:hypothetical protein A6A06_25835 [Streptomyces sp. CB02923]|uniref:hypothetical protein n=1 Tax=Streptomyces sp. CB02923 TaxID=1718985 RepID=UPI00093B7889|nr:hypothetical protein [Streptomyces sp. CB02923]OKH99022.1 hypothetical protein A6A06_25835 [Streptomyces sp. CB02923]